VIADPGSSCEEGIEDSRASWVVVAWPGKNKKEPATSEQQA